MISPDKVHDLLVEYQKVNQRRILAAAQAVKIAPESIAQKVNPSQGTPLELPTLQVGVTKRVSPMLKVRFEYAGLWENAFAGVDWLGPKEIERLSNESQVLSQIQDRMDSWDDTPLQALPQSHVTLFGIDQEDGSEVYLVWPVVQNVEPAILSYVGNVEEKYPNLGEYLNHLVHEL